MHITLTCKTCDEVDHILEAVASPKLSLQELEMFVERQFGVHSGSRMAES